MIIMQFIIIGFFILLFLEVFPLFFKEKKNIKEDSKYNNNRLEQTFLFYIRIFQL